MAQAKGFKNAKRLADAMSEHFGVRISYATIYPLWDDTAQLWSRPTIDKLCEFLQVPAGLLIQHMPGEAQQMPPQSGQAHHVEKTTRRAAKQRRTKETRAQEAVAAG